MTSSTMAGQTQLISLDVTAEVGPPVTITHDAAVQLRSLLSEKGDPELAVRITAKPGGCSGPDVDIRFDTSRSEGELAYTTDGVPIVIDAATANLVHGFKLCLGADRSGFRVELPGSASCAGCVCPAAKAYADAQAAREGC